MHKLPTRRLLVAGLAAGAVLPAFAQAPAAPQLVRLVVPFAPGGSNDVIARVVAPLLGKRLGTNVIVENKPGAAGAIGADFVAKAPKDGSTLLLTSSTLVTSAATMPKTPYDVTSAFAPVAMLGLGPMLLAVSATTPIRTAADLVAAARGKPNELTYGTAGVGSIAHMTSEMLNEAARVQTRHVPYKGAAPALLDLASGQIDMMISNYSTLAPQIKAGRVRPLAVTSRQSSAAFPDLPPLQSVAPGFAADIWVAVLAPAGTPAAVVQRYNRELNEIAAAPEVKTLLESDGALPTPLGPAEVAQRIREDLAMWKKIAADKNITVE
ncbi:MAG TPA: tripartite tricarboxylate transporter substrate-binding protein [Ramlibacter sp.]|nr:tripartite tricarboxylate transporter substrate-binding protein [Ramlibacter sp.]